MKQQVVFTHQFEQSLSETISKCNPDKVYPCRRHHRPCVLQKNKGLRMS